ncbi:uncharacterized protein BO97DRAFT_415948 [Aspergillus homomorphus CBS 101889]|uniref:Uncharacterized protein n=1 Tax=Aspergillus homomorphus (strain CBS 101889) TaxID=1450537 RepID=A0A395HR31_ASPHC|nr:hypothetical protein BO97DRAFT_415948 [Aspergillus homomorphus CBS 101889]RAL10412.1 hypothetical protein BO97DRAFT_415948 [Aspergillus homomorphus CBS 101889]
MELVDFRITERESPRATCIGWSSSLHVVARQGDAKRTINRYAYDTSPSLVDPIEFEQQHVAAIGQRFLYLMGGFFCTLLAFQNPEKPQDYSNERSLGRLTSRHASPRGLCTVLSPEAYTADLFIVSNRDVQAYLFLRECSNCKQVFAFSKRSINNSKESREYQKKE